MAFAFAPTLWIASRMFMLLIPKCGHESLCVEGMSSLKMTTILLFHTLKAGHQIRQALKKLTKKRGIVFPMDLANRYLLIYYDNMMNHYDNHDIIVSVAHRSKLDQGEFNS